MGEEVTGQTEALQVRIDALERRVRRQTGLLLVAGTTLAALVLMGEAPPRAKTVEAQAFVLVDEAGHDRAQLSLTKEGTAALVLKSVDGVSDARLAILPDGGVTLSLRSPRKSAAIEVPADGTAAVRIAEKYAKSSAELSLDPSGKPRVLLTDVEGKVAFKGP